jgi:hypothetical protein
MTVLSRIIAGNPITKDNFLSATEQEGEHIGRPVPDADNDGAFRLLADGDVEDFVYSGTATSNGTAATMVDSALSIYGDDFFIGAILEFLDGKNTENPFDDQCTADNTADWSNTGGIADAHDAGNGEYDLSGGGADCTYYVGIPVEAGVEYDIEFKVKASAGGGPTPFNVYAYFDDGAEQLDSGTAVSTSFVVISETFTAVTTGIAKIGIKWQAMAGNTYHIDYITITKGSTYNQVTITGFAQSTGTLTFGDLIPTASADTFTLTLPFASREFKVEIVSGGDAGNATFKWSHDGGDNYFGRNDPDQADWLAETEISDSSSINYIAQVLDLDNGNLAAFYNDDSDGASVVISEDNGISFGSRIDLGSGTFTKALKLSNGRVLAWLASTDLIYSDDNCATWSSLVTVGFSITDAVELSNGNIVIVYGTSSIACAISTDGGFSYSSGVIVADDANTQNFASICQCADGSLLCAYTTDEDAVNDKEIKAKRSTDGGATWGTAIDIADYGSYDLYMPSLLVDINGDVYCAFREDTSDTRIRYVKSSDHGATWGSQTALKTVASADLSQPKLSLINGYEIACAYMDNTNEHADFVRRGQWEAYSANGCSVSINGIPQSLICGVEIVWYGGAGATGDNWFFEPEYEFAMENIIFDSPSRPWRSEQDNIDCSIVIDMGENSVSVLDSIALFGCNFQTMSLQMNATNSWTPPTLDEDVDFDIVTGTVDAVYGGGNFFLDSDFALSHKYYELNGKYLMMTSGTDDGKVWKIKHQMEGYFHLDTDAATNIAIDDTFVIFGDHVSYSSSTGGIKRFVRIFIPAQETVEGYYQIGQCILGFYVALTSSWKRGFQRNNVFDIDMLRTPHGGMIPSKMAERKRVFTLGWVGDEDTRRQVISIAEYLEGKNLCLIPDTTYMYDCFCVSFNGDIREIHRAGTDMFDFSVVLEENL